MQMYYRISAVLIATTAIVLAVPGTAPAPQQPPEEKSKTAPPGVPLQARLIAKKDTYVLDLGGKTPKEFRKLRKDPFPPAPAVHLELEFRNRGDKDLTFLVGGTNPDVPLLLKLDGPGAVNLVLPALDAGMVSQPPQQVTLAPGKTHTLPITRLMTSRIGREGTASYWTEPGDYTLTATYKTAISPVPKGTKDNGKGFGPVTVISAAVKLKVVDPPKGKAQGKSEPAAARHHLLDLLPLMEAKDKSKLNEREREILPEVLKKLEKGKVRTAEMAKDAAQKYKFKASGILAEEAPHVISLLPLGTDVPDFAKQGDLVWVVQFRIFQGAITQEVWVNANTGGIRAILPLKR
jgi:hypothetical protein